MVNVTCKTLDVRYVLSSVVKGVNHHSSEAGRQIHLHSFSSTQSHHHE
jgi:hypothetical protein